MSERATNHAYTHIIGAAGELLPIGAEVYHADDKMIRCAHGGLRRDTPTFLMGESAIAGDCLMVHWTNGLLVKFRA